MKNIRFYKKSILVFSLLLLGFCCFAKIKFGDADINENNEILYTIKQELPGTFSYRSLFKAKITDSETGGTVDFNDSSSKMLTCFPEQMELILGGKYLQVRNRYGTAWINTETKSIEWKNRTLTLPVNSMRLSKMSVSPDGTWLCYTKKTGYASGKLMLKKADSKKEFCLDEKSSFNYEKVPVKWSSDGSVLVYAKNGFVYFCNPDAVFRGVEADEKFRKIGQGTINSINWCDGKFLIYIDSDLVYKINAKELYTLGLYSGIIGKGQTAGRLPASFRADKDVFSVNDDATKLVLVQNKKIFTYFKLKGISSDYLDIVYSGPYIDFNASLLESEILWDQNNQPIVWIRSLPYGTSKIKSSVYHLEKKLSKFLDISDSGCPCVSPDGKNCAFYSGSTVYVYDTKNWKRVSQLEGENIVSLLWKDNSTLVLGGEQTIKLWNILKKENSLLCVSSAVNGFWNNGEIVAEIGKDEYFSFDIKNQCWAEKPLGFLPRENILRNGRYRLFCGKTSNSIFENALYIRTLFGKAVTKPVYPESVTQNFEQKKAALAFDAYDNADGLTPVLYTLNRYLVTGTFFLNGEFIRRYPNETKQISLSRNECASMFFSTAELTRSEYILNEDYIRRGLARNEDDFNAVTDKELSVLWHAPHYSVTPKIIQDGKKAGYTYVDVKSSVSDSVTLEDAVYKKGEYLSVAELIEYYLKMLESGQNIIPVTIGLSSGTRESYLYENLDLLLSAILDAGYEIVPLRNLIEES